jgi:hypothetical protein
VLIVPFKFGSDHHCGTKRDLRSLDWRESEKGSSDEGEAKVMS